MGWVWRNDDDGRENNITASDDNSERCSTRRIVKSQCKTEEVEPGKFVRKCEKTEEVLRECLGRPVEVLQSNKEYTEDDVTDQVVKGSYRMESADQAPFDFPGLRSDIEAIERSIFGNLDHFFKSAEDMKDSFFSIFGGPHLYDDESWSSRSPRRGIPIQGRPHQEASVESSKPDSGHIDLDGLAKDV